MTTVPACALLCRPLCNWSLAEKACEVQAKRAHVPQQKLLTLATKTQLQDYPDSLYVLTQQYMQQVTKLHYT